MEGQENFHRERLFYVANNAGKRTFSSKSLFFQGSYYNVSQQENPLKNKLKLQKQHFMK